MQLGLTVSGTGRNRFSENNLSKPTTQIHGNTMRLSGATSGKAVSNADSLPQRDQSSQCDNISPYICHLVSIR